MTEEPRVYSAACSSCRLGVTTVNVAAWLLAHTGASSLEALRIGYLSPGPGRPVARILDRGPDGSIRLEFEAFTVGHGAHEIECRRVRQDDPGLRVLELPGLEGSSRPRSEGH